MNLKASSLLFIIILAISIKSFSQKKKIEIGPNTIGINENLNITITVENEGLQNYSDFPEIEGFIKRGRSSSSSTNYINGKMSSTQSIIQSYIPKNTGNIIVPPFSMKINNQTIKSKGGEINVIDKKYTQKNDPFNRLFDPFDNFFKRNENNEFIDIKADAFLSLNTNKNEVYIGEGVTTTLSLFVSEKNQADMRFFDLGKQLTEIVKKIKPRNCWEENYNIESINGISIELNKKRYTEYKIFEATYFPFTTGKILFPKLSLDLIQYQIAKNPSFFGQNKKEKIKKFTSNSKEVNVIDLPPHPLKENVVVGNFQVKEKIEAINLATEKSFNYEFEILGNGNINAIREPEVNVEAFDFYPPNILQKINRKNKIISGSKKFQYHVIPNEPGIYNFSDIQWVFFNPIEKKYDTLKSKIIVDVTGISTKNKNIESNDYDDFYKKIELEENNIIRKKKKDHYLLFLNFTLLSLILIITALIIKKYK